MADLKEIKSRIGSIGNTQQITRAMKMVSAAKLRRAQDRIINLRPYANGLMDIISDIASTNRVSHDLMVKKENPKSVLFVVITSDRGLCGGFNNNINRYTEKLHKEIKDKYEKIDFFFVGRRGANYFKSRDVNTRETLLNLARVIDYPLAKKVSDDLKKYYLTGEYDEVKVIYNEFKSVIAQEIVCEQLIPVDTTKSPLMNNESSRFSKDLIFEPAPEEMLEDLLIKHFAIQIYRCMSESVAAEHGARMSAMENATKNAQEMKSKLTLTYNNLRQASITKELIEITSGAEALN